MKKINKSILVAAVGLSLFACKKSAPTAEVAPAIKIDHKDAESATPNDSAEVVKIKEFINKSILTEADQKAISKSERRFRYQDADLNGDGSKETFVLLDSPYFCGSGGCTILLMSAEQKLITKFTVTRPPIFVEPPQENGWKILTVKSGSEWKKLAYDGTKYPSNPTVLKKAPYDAPSGHAEIIFPDGGVPQTFEF